MIFDKDIQYYYYKGEDPTHTDFVRESDKRKINEECLLKHPRTELKRVTEMIAEWRKYDVNIVFGNLGRQPHLLNYFLDLCFSFQEDIHIECKWTLPSPYQTKKRHHSDFLFIVEPHFGYTHTKPSQVKHLVVLTSHLNLNIQNQCKKFYILHLSSSLNKNMPDPNIKNALVIRPPIFHDQNYESLPDDSSILLDVSESKSANEAYLKILTGKEMIQKRPFNIIIKDRDRQIIEKMISITKNKAKEIKDDISCLSNMYWSI